jgi:LacI family transcriptional regulator/LacI family repressor for deo operon, udp, cdd, tsx, nupC, and nupG
MAVSIYDIAKRAKVAPSTVSRALQDHPRIGEQTRERIKQIAREMDYVPSTVARSLFANRTWTIGMIVPTIPDPFMGRIVEGVEHVAIEAGFNVLLSTSQNDRQRELTIIDIFQQRRVDGIIVYSSDLINQYSQSLGPNKVPTVIINEPELEETIHCVTVNEAQAAQSAVEHLIALGHRHIGYIGNINRLRSNQHRLNGYRTALEAAGIAFDSTLVITPSTPLDYTRHGESSLELFLAAGITAVFCFNDLTAMGLLLGCYKRGLVVPDDISVVGFDDIDMSAYAIPPLTTMRQPRFDLGRQAMHMMFDLLDGQQPENQILPCELVIRQTTARCTPGE